MVQGEGQHQRLLAPLYGLHRIAQAPQSEGCKAEARHARRITMAKHQGPLCHGVDEGNALLQVPPGRSVFTQLEQSLPEGAMRLQAVCRVGRTLG